MFDPTTVTLEECERQATVLALALMALLRPGWDDFLGRIAAKMGAREMYEQFKYANRDTIKPADPFPPADGPFHLP
jgi:hypothetical protein